MNDRIEKKQVLDAMRLIKQYCNEESGCEFCDFYRSGDCITTLSLPCSWDLDEFEWTAQEAALAKALLNYDVDAIDYNGTQLYACKSEQDGTYTNFRVISTNLFPSITAPGKYSLTKIANRETD